jgi:putative transposase
VNWKKLYRICREERPTVRKRGGRKRALGTRAPMAIPQGPNQRWSLDFVSDALEDGRRSRVLCVIDDFSRECLAAVVDTSLSGARVARELDRIAEARGYPCMVVSDDGTEPTSNAMLRWQENRKVEWRPPWASNRWRPHGEPSHRASRCRTAWSRASTESCETNASKSTCSAASAMPET